MANNDDFQKAYEIFKIAYRREAFLLSPEVIHLKYKVHKNPFTGGIEIPEEKRICIANILSDGKLALVLGWGDYQLAKAEGKPIRTIVLNYGTNNPKRGKFVDRKVITQKIQQCFLENKEASFVVTRTKGKLVQLSDIIVPFKEQPSNCKVKRAKAVYKSLGDVDIPAVIDSKMILRDGYARYCALKELGVQRIRTIMI